MLEDEHLSNCEIMSHIATWVISIFCHCHGIICALSYSSAQAVKL